MASIPDIKTDRKEGYAHFLGANYDSVQECYACEIPEKLVERLDYWQRDARQKHEGQGGAFEFGGALFQIWGGGSQGNRWVFENDDMQFHIRTDKPSFNISVRYKAAGLWEHGIHALKATVKALLLSEIVPLQKDWITLSRIDYAFDYYSPQFSKEMLSRLIADQMVLTSGVKAGLVFTSTGNETLTIGMNRKGVQIQVYDKGKEITQASGKTWMFKIWEREGYFPPDDMKAKDVWRFEVRCGKDFLKDRNIKTFEDFDAQAGELITEAIMRRRCIDNPHQEHKERAPLHPFWAEIYHAAGEVKDYIPIGRQLTMKRHEYIEMLKKQQAGLGRSISVAKNGHYNSDDARKDAAESVTIAIMDEEHENKVLKASEKQRFIDEAE